MTDLPDLSTIAFFAFIGFGLAVVIATILLIRSSIGASIMSSASQHAKTYAVAYVKGGVLMAIAMIAAFDEAFHPLSKMQAANLAWWDWAILFLKPVSAACAVLVAFLDKSIQRAGEAKAAADAKTNPPFATQ